MKFERIFILAALLMMGTGPTFANYLPLCSDVPAGQPQATILSSDAAGIQLEVRLAGIELLQGTLEGKRWDRVEITGGGYEQDLGCPEVPHFTRLVAIPAQAGVRAEFEALETATLPNLELMPAQGSDPEDLVSRTTSVRYDAAVYHRNAFYPETRLSIGEPAVMRGVRLVTVRMNPIQYNPVTRELRVTTRFRVTIHFEGEDWRSVPTRQIPMSSSWANSLSGALLNADDLDVDSSQPGSYLIICKNDAGLINYLQPLMEWKMRKGHSVTLQTFNYGANNYAIKTLIQNAYDTWPVPPEFVLLVGDVTGTYALPGWQTNDNYVIDHPYSQLEGNDILADVALGRLPAGSSTEVQTMVNKILYYEKMPYTTSTDWYHQGVVIAGNANAGLSSVQVNRWIKTRMVQLQYTRIDTFWYWMSGSVAGTLTPAINDGVLFANYRGNNHMENFTTYSIDNLTNGRKLPFVVTITCGTGGFGGWGMSGESLMQHFVTVGTPTSPKGAVACVGTATLDTHTRQNNTVDMGTWAGIFDLGITYAGEALNYGKLQLYYTYEQHDPQSVDDFSKWNALAGDPGLELFTHAIQYMTCDVPASLPYGENSLSLTVNETGVGPLENATVCFYKSGTGGMQAVGYTDANGQVTLPISVTAAGNLKVTITKQNFYPIVDSLDIVQAAVAVGYYSHSVDDDNLGGSSGDNDHVVNPGEIVQIPLTLKNFGSSTTATGVSATGSLNDAYATLSSATQSFPNLPPGSTGNSSGSYLVTVAPNCPNGHGLPLMFSASSGQGSWPGIINLSVVSYDLAVLSAVASGSDSLLSPGETANFVLTVSNVGGKTAANLTATLTSLSSYVTVNDNSASFGTVNVNSTATCSANPFNLTAAANTPPGYQANLAVTFNANGATQTDTLTIALGAKTQADPTGPDAYGYYCFDNTDVNYPQHPTYAWMEIDPAYGGGGTQLAISDPGENLDASVVVNLPFTFRYYGQTTNAITVCSNGWLSCYPDNSFNDFRNYPIPTPMGPFAMIAPFWDDLITWSGGHVFTRYEAANHRFVVEWSRLNNLTSITQQVFEAILLDPAYYPTPTGDGEILFQYNAITQVAGPGDDNPYSTVGIESWDQQTGIEVTYWNTYDDPATAPLANSRAYLFTTNFSYQPAAPSPVDITLTPINPPIQIPASGGAFSFNVTIQNVSATPQTFDAWIMQKLPNGSWQGPMIGPVNLTLTPGFTLTRTRNQNVPGSAMAGVYTYIGYVGVYTASTKWDSSYFNYTKLSSGDGLWVGDWNNWGESFDPWLTTNAVQLPDEFALEGAYPNPFNPTTVLSFELPVASLVRLEVFDITGRAVGADLRVRPIAGSGAHIGAPLQEYFPAGTHQILFDGSDLPSGIYLARLTAGDWSAVQKMVLMK